MPTSLHPQPQPPPTLTPLPTYKQLKQSIPTHCFNRPTLRSLIYPIRDCILLAFIGYLAIRFIGFQIGFVSVLGWGVYAYVQGTVAFGLFIVGHQCGHGAFSDIKVVNDVVGYLTHTFILVPYFSWQRSHFVHHSKNNHLLDNESHQPSHIKKSKQQYQTTYNLFGHYGFIFIQLLTHSVGGWLIYLFFHGTGSRRNPYTKQQYKSIPNHFSPFQSNQLFAKEMRFRVFLSTFGVVGMVIWLVYMGWCYGFLKVGLVYVGPYMVTFCWLVVITWLQHTQPDVPHYGEDQWTWLKGAVLTIDRNYPWIIDHLHHRIGTTHVLHHIFPEIPHYHAVQANKAIMPLLGNNYRYDPTPITKVIWRLANQCHFVEELEGVQYYRSFLKVKKEEKEGKGK